MKLTIVLCLIGTLFPLIVDSGLNVKVGVKLPSINVKIPNIKLPTIKITTVIKHSRSKKPLKIKLPAISFDAEAEKEKEDDWWSPTPEPWSESETESTPTSGWGDIDPWSSTSDDKSEHEQIDKWLAEKRRERKEKSTDSGWNEVKEDSWSTVDDHRPSKHTDNNQQHYPADGYSKSERPQPYSGYPYPSYGYAAGWPTGGGWSGWGWGHWPAWPTWPSHPPSPSTTKPPATKEEKKEDPPKDDS